MSRTAPAVAAAVVDTDQQQDDGADADQVGDDDQQDDDRDGGPAAGRPRGEHALAAHGARSSLCAVGGNHAVMIAERARPCPAARPAATRSGERGTHSRCPPFGRSAAWRNWLGPLRPVGVEASTSGYWSWSPWWWRSRPTSRLAQVAASGSATDVGSGDRLRRRQRAGGRGHRLRLRHQQPARHLPLRPPTAHRRAGRGRVPGRPGRRRRQRIGGLHPQIRVGDPLEEVTGLHRYVIRYTLDGVASDGDLAWDAVGTGWDVPIDDVEVHVLLSAGLATRGVRGRHVRLDELIARSRWTSRGTSWPRPPASTGTRASPSPPSSPARSTPSRGLARPPRHPGLQRHRPLSCSPPWPVCSRSWWAWSPGGCCGGPGASTCPPSAYRRWPGPARRSGSISRNWPPTRRRPPRCPRC